MESVLLIILQVLLGIFFLVAGVMKVVGHDHMVREFKRFDYPFWLMRLAGAVEVISAPGLLLAFWLPLWAFLGSALLSCVMVGATYTNFTKRPPVFGWGTVVILGLCAVVVAAYAPHAFQLLNRSI
ncbi:MAG: DoxX family protein [Pseudomonadales bacterium]|nr:DoxX family protein [Pseudomonadales bacterium]